MAGSGMQQSTGHTAAQASCSWNPTHSVQSWGSITKMSSPWLMAWLGHSGSQAPQLMHSTVIRVDMAAVLYDGSGVAGGKPAVHSGQEGSLEVGERLLGRGRRRGGASGLVPLRGRDPQEGGDDFGIELGPRAAGDLLAHFR